MKPIHQIAIWLLSALAALTGIGWLGLRVPPRNFASPVTEPQDLGSVAIPSGLPVPVRRYLQTVCGDSCPRIESMMAWGHARANFGVWMPLRFRLSHRPGYDFRREMDVTWFGLPVIKALDQYINGKGMTGPVGSAATGPEVNQGSNLILWAEAGLFPSLLISDPRIRWQAIDDHSARLIVPFGDQTDELTFHFDPQSGLPHRISALRYREPGGQKIPWHADTERWQQVNGVQVPARVAITWEDQGTPWSVWEFEGVLWNVDISEALPSLQAEISAS